MPLNIRSEIVNQLAERLAARRQVNKTDAVRIALQNELRRLDEARRVFDELAKAGIDYDDVTETLEREGVEKFSESFDELLKALGAKQESLAPA